MIPVKVRRRQRARLPIARSRRHAARSALLPTRRHLTVCIAAIVGAEVRKPRVSDRRRSVERKRRRPESVERAAHAGHAILADVRINHRRAGVGMPQQFLHRAHVVAQLRYMRCETLARRMATDPFVSFQASNRCRHAALGPREDMMAARQSIADSPYAHPLWNSSFVFPLSSPRSPR